MAFRFRKDFILYGISLALLMFLLHWLELRFLILSYSLEIFTAAVALLFTGLGVWLAVKIVNPKTITVEKEVYIEKQSDFVSDETVLAEIGLSKREFEVLKLLSEGMSNEEIASGLFVSVPTVKTHISNLYVKLDVRRRTQAVEKARKLKLLP